MDDKLIEYVFLGLLLDNVMTIDHITKINPLCSAHVLA